MSLRFVLTALRRRRRTWLCLAAVGLIIGLGFHFVVPRSYTASSTLYLTQAPGQDQGVAMANDVALLQTSAVGDRAIAILGQPHLTSAGLLGKQPGTAESDNVLSISVAGSTKTEAVERVNAVATAFLKFRAERSHQETLAANTSVMKQIAALRNQIDEITAKINAQGPSAQGQDISTLVAEQSTDTGEVATLEQSIQQQEAADTAVSSGSRVLTPGSVVHVSTLKLFGLSGISGLIAGLVIGMGLVALQAVFSDRLRRREEVASLLGAPVELSIPRFRHPRRRTTRWVKRMAAHPKDQIAALAGYLRRRGVPGGDRTTLLVVATDDLAVPAAALASLATKLALEGKSVLVADFTGDQILARAMADVDTNGTKDGGLSVFVPSADEVSEMSDPPWLALRDGAQAVIALATVDPGRGAWHLAWSKEIVITVTVGCSSAKRVNSTAALVRAAGISIRSGVLLEADDDDETLGLLQPGSPLVGLPLDAAYTTSVSQ